jgi:hypothetical protein
MKSTFKNVSFLSFVVIILLSFSLVSCKESTSSTENTQQINQITTQDSTELTNLVLKTYMWVETSDLVVGDFEPLQNNPTDTIYSGIDLQAQKVSTEQLEKSGFFAKEFVENYQNIATKMDKKLKNGSAVWEVGYLPPFVGSGVNAWCNSQDYPEKYWEKLRLSKFEKQGEETSFVWNLDNGFTYKVRAKKENEVWKISYLEGFDEKNYEVEVIE